MKSAIEEALDNVKKLNVQKLEEPKPEKKDKDEAVLAMPYDERPSLYLDDKELSTIGDYKIDDKIILVIECTVKGISSHSRMDGKESKKVLNCDLCIESIADITKG